MFLRCIQSFDAMTCNIPPEGKQKGWPGGINLQSMVLSTNAGRSIITPILVLLVCDLPSGTYFVLILP